MRSSWHRDAFRDVDIGSGSRSSQDNALIDWSIAHNAKSLGIRLWGEAFVDDAGET